MRNRSGIDWQILLLGVIVLLTRLPFLSQGYGTEEDSWGLALYAWKFHETGIYEESRLPGHPLQELILGLSWNGSPWLFNFYSALMSAFAVIFFAGSAKRLGIRNYLPAGAALAFIPVIYINSTCTIDYIWALAFAMAAFYFYLGEKYLLAGVFLGLAMGCRITSGAFLGIFIMFHASGFFTRKAWLDTIKVFVTAILIAGICFIPVLQRHGAEFFFYYDQFPYPGIMKFIYKMSFGVWGALGLITLGIFLIPAIRNRVAGDKRIIAGFITALILYFIAYLRLPQKSAYMIPVVPFTLLFFYHLLSEKQSRIFSLMLILSPFLFSINLTDPLRGAAYSSSAVVFKTGGQEIFFDPLSGPILSERSKRMNKMAFTDRVVNTLKKMEEPGVVISGWWYNEICVKLIDGEVPSVKPAFYLTEPELQHYHSILGEGRIFYLPEQDLYNDLYSGISNTKEYAILFSES